jgi:hypothetical protein
MSAKRFGFETGYRLLLEEFTNVRLKHYPDHLALDKVDPLLNYLKSKRDGPLDPKEETYFREFLQGKIDQDGEILISKDVGLFICWNES